MANTFHQISQSILLEDNRDVVKENNLKAKIQLNLESLSSLGLKYPKLRDHPLHTAQQWLESKKLNDGAEGLWRIYNKLYDFSSFINSHPGGKDWLELTKGTDITEAFESHHLSNLPESLLISYYIREARQPRNSPFTFHETDFYKTLKRNVYKKLLTLPKTPANRSKYLSDSLLAFYIITAILATYFRSFTIGTLSGIALAWTAVAAHNFFHQKDNFRMYYFNFTLMSSKDWRISHALSHHIYTNTIYDMEVSSVEPFLQYLPTKKNLIFRYLSWVYSPIVYAGVYIGFFIRKFIQIILNGERLPWDLFLPFTVPILMFLVSGQSTQFSIFMFLWIITTSSIYFAAVGLNAGHHHPDLFHDGDATRPKEEMDWGVFQMDAVMDGKDITGSHLLVLTNFGDHALHHLFPTIDHGYLEYLYPVFLDTCKQFGLEWKLSPQIELVKGQFKQLARVEPNREPPKPLNIQSRERIVNF